VKAVSADTCAQAANHLRNHISVEFFVPFQSSGKTFISICTFHCIAIAFCFRAIFSVSCSVSIHYICE